MPRPGIEAERPHLGVLSLLRGRWKPGQSQLRTKVSHSSAKNQNERTWGVTISIETFEGINTPRHQLCYPPKVILLKPRERELPEVKTAW